MTIGAFGSTPFSAVVDLWLDCEFGRVPLSQTASTFVIAASPRDIPPCRATVVISVDGHEHRRSVNLIHGMSASNPHTAALAEEPPF